MSPWTWRAKSRKCFTGSPALGPPLCAAGEGFCSFAARCLPAFLKVVCPSYQTEFVFLTLLACARLKVLFSNRNNRVVRSCVPPFFLYVTGLSFCVSNFTLAENKHFRVDIERTTRRRRREQCRTNQLLRRVACEQDESLFGVRPWHPEFTIQKKAHRHWKAVVVVVVVNDENIQIGFFLRIM